MEIFYSYVKLPESIWLVIVGYFTSSQVGVYPVYPVINLLIGIENIWLVVTGTWFFADIGNHNPNWLICFRGVETTNQISKS